MFSSVFHSAVWVVYVGIFLACQATPADLGNKAIAPEANEIQQPAPIRYIAIKTGNFQVRTFATATLHAVAKTEIKTAIGGQIIALPVREGSFIRQNEALVRLDPTAIELRLKHARLALEEAEFNKNDLLTVRGGRWGEDSSVNETALQSIYHQSGYKKALNVIESLDYELRQTRLPAPFDGLVAGLKVALHQHVAAGETICTLIDPFSFEAVFLLLEKEAMQFKTGQQVKVQLITEPETILHATLSAINPVVDERGLVRFHAAFDREDLRRHRASLLEGMNLRVIIEKAIPHQLVIPKSALVLRSGKPVVFTYDEAAGLAKWNYVTVAFENDSEAAISEGLKDGDLIIFEGNLNLDHDAQVTVDKSSSAARQ
jgi:RND family efflux transporter MFP subunit